MKQVSLLVLIFGTFMQTVWATEDLMTSHLVDQARHWQQKSRDDIAADIWRSLLRSDPEHVEALVKLGLIEARVGNRLDAQRLFEHANRISPRPPGLAELTAVLTTESTPRGNAVLPPVKQMTPKAETRSKASTQKTPPAKKTDRATNPDALVLKP